VADATLPPSAESAALEAAQNKGDQWLYSRQCQRRKQQQQWRRRKAVRG